MASIRLNKETRSQIAKAIVDEHFPNTTSTALSVNVHSLNKELGLPK